MTSISLKTNVRNSNLELLRIVSMILIIMHHYSVHGGFDLINSDLSLNQIWVQILSLGGKLGVNCFILITGYFMITSTFKFKSILKIILEVLFYSIIPIFIFYGFNIMDISFKVLIQSILPINFNLYWFATTYIILYFLIPFINNFIQFSSKRNILKLIILLSVIWSVFPTFLFPALGFSEIGWFILLYIIAAYIRLYPNSLFNKYKFNLCSSVVIYILIILSVIVIDIISMKIDFAKNHATYFSGINRLPILLLSISLFLTFKNLNIKNNKFINIIASTMFGVYLIHDNILVSPFLWKTLFKNAKYLDSSSLFLHSIITILLVFIGCILIDYLRIILLEKPLFNWLENRDFKVINKIRVKSTKILDQLENF